MYHDIVFTRKAFDAAIRINDKDTEYRVKGKEHLRLIVYNCKITLMVRNCFEGVRKSKRIGTYPMMGLATFEKLANEYIETQEAGGNYNLALKAPLNQYFDQVYLPTAKKNKRSWKDDKSRFRLYIALTIGMLKLAKIKPFHIQKLLNELPEHLSDRSHDLIRALLSVIFNQAIRLELIDKNPCRVIPTKNNCRVIVRYMRETECTAWIQSCLVEADIHSDNFSFQSLCLLLALLTGMRIGNCIAVTCSMLSEDGNSLYLPRTKSGKGQTIYLSPQAQWVIQEALTVSSSEYIFPSMVSVNAHIARPVSAFKRICKRAGIACSGSNHVVNDLFPHENLTIHCLRKTFSTIILNNFSSLSTASNASSIDIVRQLLGHTTEGVTRKHYAFSDDNNLVAGVNIAGSIMTKAIRELPITAKH